MTLKLEAAKTNIPLLDNQHAKYFDAVEKLLDLCRSNKPDRAGVREILDHAQEYALDNFDTEEYLMELEEYPDAEQHIAKHEQFKDRIDFFSDQAGSASTDLRDLAKHLRALLVSWFNDQIKDDDMRLAAFLKKRQRNRGVSA